MAGFVTDIESETKENSLFRKVIFTAPHCQLVLMTLPPNEDIGEEVHEENDQFFRIESGQGKAVIDGEVYELKDGSAVVVTAGTKHNIKNTSSTAPLHLYTIYAPAHHPDGTIHSTKAEAIASENSDH